MYSENKLRFATNNKFVSRMPLLFKVGRKYSDLLTYGEGHAVKISKEVIIFRTMYYYF